MEKSDILIFISDQHNARITGYEGDKIVKTPVLDEIARNGTVFGAAYTSYPLCVPARVSMLTGQLPSRTGIFTNQGCIPCDQATFFHSLAAEGYETVLCGRMHFIGADQRHGFTKRIFGEFSHLNSGWNRQRSLGRMKNYYDTLGVEGCLNIIGGGNSPVLEYDRGVINAALEYLSQNHDKPQCIVVGTYAPHFTYIAPPQLYDYYQGRVGLPISDGKSINYNFPYSINPVKTLSEDIIKNSRAAYYGMVENMDSQIGQIRSLWQEYLERSNRKGVFIYMSDHGDQIGEKHLFGKQTFFEGSSRIPMVIEGSGISAGKWVNEPVSIMDISPTLCELAGASTIPNQDGISLIPLLQGKDDCPKRYVISELVFSRKENDYVVGRMIREGQWKLIVFLDQEEYILLFDLQNDPNELINVAGENADIVTDLRNKLFTGWDVSEMIDTYTRKKQHVAIINKFIHETEPFENELWIPSEESFERLM